MQHYWKCIECDEVHLYPNVIVCETCGTPISHLEKQRVLKEIEIEEKYNKAVKDMKMAVSIEQFDALANIFGSILGYEDAEQKWNVCLSEAKVLREKAKLYSDAINAMDFAKTEYEYNKAAELFRKNAGYRDANKKMDECLKKAALAAKEATYNKAIDIMNSAKSEEDFNIASEFFEKIANFRDANQKKKECLDNAKLAAKKAVYSKAMEAYEKGRSITIFNWRKYV